MAKPISVNIKLDPVTWKLFKSQAKERGVTLNKALADLFERSTGVRRAA